MPSIIHILPDNVVNKIAAGEVVERPASAVKELVENAIDAAATDILIDIEQAGRRLIRITDNGCGMSKEDAQSAFQRHATSKITSDDDLQAIRTMGFRGEALSSIASVSQARLLTSPSNNGAGTLVEIEAGKLIAVKDAAAPQGTSFEIAHLFYNTPARLKFLKSPATEFTHILTAVSRLAMAHPSVCFRLTHNKKQVLDLPASTNVRDRVFQLYGSEIAENVVDLSGGRDGIQVYGLISRPAYTRGDRTYQDFYVNRRAVKNASLTHALYGAYNDMIMRDRHPAAFIFVDIDPALVDVNVHPAKAEVRFRNQAQVHDLVRDIIREGLRSQNTSPTATHAGRVEEAVSEYLHNAEFGMRPALAYPLVDAGCRRNAEYKPIIRSSGELQQSLSSSPLISDDKDNSAFRIPHSEYLFPLAQIHNSFIIAQSRDGMALIDQHAAHERVLFEKLQDQASAGTVPVQNLLLPIQVELGPAQANLLTEHIGELEKLGFTIDDFGNNAFMIKAVPSLLAGADAKKLLLDILDEMNTHGKSRNMTELLHEVLSVMACHPAIKINRRLEPLEMETLLRDLFLCRMPYTCPHGRPTVIQFSIDEIHKMFKRI